MSGSIRFPLTSFGVVTTVALLCASNSRAQAADEKEFDRTPVKCLATARIRDTDILDDRTIIFYLRGNRQVYRTYLPRACPGLERNERFAYQTRNSQLCSIDLITVLEQYGAGLQSGATCRLSDFIPITREEAEDLKLDKTDDGLKRNAIRSERAEPAPEGEAAQAGAADDAAADDAAADQAAPAPPPPPAEPPKRAPRGSGVTSR
jgi:hypothetical protein